MSIAADIIKNYLTSPEAAPEIKDTINRMIDSTINVDADGAAQTEVDSIQTNIDTIESDLDAAEAAIVVLDAALTALAGAYATHDHSVGDPTQVDHDDLTGVTADQHHDKYHDLNPTPGEGLDPHHNDIPASLPESYILFDEAAGHAHGGGTDGAFVDHSALAGVGADDHHAESHSLASHSTKAHAELTDVTADQHHAQEHDVEGASDRETTAVEGSVLISKDGTNLEMTRNLRKLMGLFGDTGKKLVHDDQYADIAAALADVDVPGKVLFEGRLINIKTAGEYEQEVYCPLINRGFEIDDGEAGAPYGWTEVP